MMKVPDPRLNLTMSLLKALNTSHLDELAENCGMVLSNIAKPLAISISVRIPGLPKENYQFGSKSNLSTIDNILKDFGLTAAAKERKIPNSIALTTEDDKAIGITPIKYMGNPIGYVAAIADGSESEFLSISEAVWLCASQLGIRIHSLLAPASSTADEIMGRRILSELIADGIRGICIISTSEDRPWLSLSQKDNKTILHEIEKVQQKRLSGIDDGEIINDDLISHLWPNNEIPAGIWMLIRPGHYLAIGLEDKKLITSQIIGKIREAIERAVSKDSEYLAKSFERLKADFKKLVRSERAAAITETAVTINHEINNPLTAILGHTQLLLMSKDKLPADVIAKLETIERSAIKIRETTSKLMAIIEPVTTPYASGLEMIDIEKSKKKKNHST
jgi:hypothetical protein